MPIFHLFVLHLALIHISLFPNMSVVENVEYALKLRAELKQNSRKIALSTLEAIGMLCLLYTSRCV